MKTTVIENIQNFVNDYQKNSNITTQWGVPIVGFASASDPLFARLSSVASPTHAVPQDFLHKYGGSCQKCTQKCVNGALSAQSFDRFKCYEMLLKNVEKHRSIGYVDACGKCLVGLPCSYINPVERKRQTGQGGG